MGKIALKKVVIVLLTLIFLATSAHYLYQRQRDAREEAEFKEAIGKRWTPPERKSY